MSPKARRMAWTVAAMIAIVWAIALAFPRREPQVRAAASEPQLALEEQRPEVAKAEQPAEPSEAPRDVAKVEPAQDAPATVPGACTRHADCGAGRVCIGSQVNCSGGGICAPEVPCELNTQCGFVQCQASGGKDCHCYSCPANTMCAPTTDCYTCRFVSNSN